MNAGGEADPVRCELMDFHSYQTAKLWANDYNPTWAPGKMLDADESRWFTNPSVTHTDKMRWNWVIIHPGLVMKPG